MTRLALTGTGDARGQHRVDVTRACGGGGAGTGESQAEAHAHAGPGEELAAGQERGCSRGGIGWRVRGRRLMAWGSFCRYSVGIRPTRRRKTRLKWVSDWNPTS
jgi:hypothetical protein